MASGSWLVIEEMLERGDPRFVAELRACEDAPRLANFAASWHADRRPQARRFLLQYLLQPLNAYHHEGLVKRLFKLAEAAGDDEVMAHFLVLFDRSIRRRLKKTTRFLSETFSNRRAAEAQVRQWQASGAESAGVNTWSNNHNAWALWPVERPLAPHRSVMPRQPDDFRRTLRLRGRLPRSLHDLPEDVRRKVETKRLFSVHTRHYLRRRAWRYFRNLAVTAPARYIPAVTTALKLYEDTDMPDGLALLDNWGLIHILFHDSPVLWARSHGWTVQPSHGLGEVTPAPAFPDLWREAPAAILDLLRLARCRPVRQWALFYLRQDPAILDGASVEFLLDLLQSSEPEIVTMAAKALESRSGLEAITVSRWLGLIESAPAAALDAICQLVRARVRPGDLTLEQLVQFACSRPAPIARLGLAWLQERTPGDGDWRVLSRLADAEAESVRPELLRWLRTALAGAGRFDPQWVLEFLDSRHEDVRSEGWVWLLDEPRARDDVQIWQRLFESPYDEIRTKLVAYLENRFARRSPAIPADVPLEPETVRLLWATVLLNVKRGNRSKPLVIRQIVRCLAGRPDDSVQLLPILRVAFRSIRGPEWRAGLSGIVHLVEQRPELEKTMRDLFPELQLAAPSA